MLAEACRAGYPFVMATHDELNAASGCVMERCGMTYRCSYRECWQPKDIDVVFKLYQIDFAPDTPTYSGYWGAIHSIGCDGPSEVGPERSPRVVRWVDVICGK